MGVSSSFKKDEESDGGTYPGLPLCYSSDYNIGFLGLENLHPFDSKKYQKIYNTLIASKLVHKSQFVKPAQIDDKTLKLVHPQDYLDSLTSSATVARMIEVPPVAILPNSWVNKQVLVPMRCATKGSLIASEMALKYGWGINLAGGYHHASASDGGGFCIFADISLIIANMRTKFGNVANTKQTPSNDTNNNNNIDNNNNITQAESKLAHIEEEKEQKDGQKLEKFMIVDLDAHQGNGHENDKVNGLYEKYGADVFIFDVYNKWIYPGDSYAKIAINAEGHLGVDSNIKDNPYLQLLRERLPVALDTFKPDFVIYNAGTDCLENDPLGRMDLTEGGIVERDFIVWDQVLEQRKIPLVMLLSGGYQQNNAAVISRSIVNLNVQFNLFREPMKLAPKSDDKSAQNDGTDAEELAKVEDVSKM